MKRAGVYLAAALLALAGCSGGERGGDCPSGKACLRAGNASDPGSLDPAHAFLKQDQQVIDDLLVGLATFDAQGRVVPGLARSWTTTPDGLFWRFALRPALWSDGRPVTADDVVFTFRRLLAPSTGAGYAVLLQGLVNGEAYNQGRAGADQLGVSAPDPQTVELRLAHPVPYLPFILAHYGVAIVPRHAVERWGDGWTQPGRFVSSGPFTLVSWKLGDRIVLAKNPRFYDAAHVCLDRVSYFPTADATAAERQIRRGELHWNSGFGSNRIRFLMGPRGMPSRVRIAPWTDLTYIIFQMRSGPLADLRVRQALTMALDREFIAGRLLQAGQTPTDAFVPAGLGLPRGRPDWAGAPLVQRQARARLLLAEAGYGPGHPLHFELKHSIAAGVVPVALQADWRAVGVEATLTREDTAVFFNDLQLGDFQAGLTDWIADYPDPSNFLNLMRSDQSASNYGGFRDPAYDGLLRQSEAEPDLARRAMLQRQAETRLLEAAAVAPVFENPSHNLVREELTGWADNLNDVHPARYLCLPHAGARPGRG